MDVERDSDGDCPRCGCADTRIEKRRHGPDRLRCNLCGHGFPVMVVEYIRTKCPFCGSKEVPIYSKPPGRLRYHKCKQCELTFKSREPID